jgi:hypothetical protein
MTGVGIMWACLPMGQVAGAFTSRWFGADDHGLVPPADEKYSSHSFTKRFEPAIITYFPIHHSTRGIEVWPNCHYKEILVRILRAIESPTKAPHFHVRIPVSGMGVKNQISISRSAW